MKNQTLTVQGTAITLVSQHEAEYISLTDMVKAFEGGDQLIKNWLQNKNTVEFLSVWEKINNPKFNLVEFHQIKTALGLNRFILSIKTWIQLTNAIGLIAKAGRYGGTYAHQDIAFEFASWLSPEFKLYLIKEFQRLKRQESQQAQLEWGVKRALTKINYRIHTDAVKANLIPPLIPKHQEAIIYASEADVLNKALFGLTASEWRTQNPQVSGNMRDYATASQLVVLANMESLNAILIQQGVSQAERVHELNAIAINQMRSLTQYEVEGKLKQVARLSGDKE